MGYPPSNQPSQPWQPTGPQQPQGYPPQSQEYSQQPQGYPPQPQGYPPQPGYTQPYGGAPTLAPIPQKKGGAGKVIGIIAGVLVLVLVVCAVGAVALSKIAKNVLDNNYSTTLPGPKCDKGVGKWELATDDTTLSGACQTGGYLLSKAGKFDTSGELFFDGKGSTFKFSKAYRVEVAATIQNTDQFTEVGLEVHRNMPQGGQRFYARANHEWDVAVFDDNGNQSKQLAIGFLPQATKTFDLAVDVNGAVMTYTINGKQVATVTDATYSTTQAIGLTLGDADATSSISALFSNFKYTQLPNPTLSDTDAVATATAAQTAAATTPYKAAVPGPGCDSAGGQWAAPDYFGVTGLTLACGTNSLSVTQAADANSLTAARFYNLNGNFPANYSVGVKIDLSKMNATGGNPGCAGVYTRSDADHGRYAYLVCTDGGWIAAKFDKDGKETDLAQGLVTAKNSYTITATADGSTQKLAIDGKTVASVDDSTLSNTSYVSLIMFAPDKVTGTTEFSNFVFTPMP